MAQSPKPLDQDSCHVLLVFTCQEVTAISAAAWPCAACSIRFALGSRIGVSPRARVEQVKSGLPESLFVNAKTVQHVAVAMPTDRQM